MQTALPKLFDRLSSYIGTKDSHDRHVTSDDTEGDDWDWVDSNNTPTTPKEISYSQNDEVQLVEVMSVIETYVENLMDPLKVVRVLFVSAVRIADVCNFESSGLCAAVCEN